MSGLAKLNAKTSNAETMDAADNAEMEIVLHARLQINVLNVFLIMIVLHLVKFAPITIV